MKTPKVNRRVLWLKRIVLVCAVLFLVIFLRSVDFAEVYDTLAKVGWNALGLLVITGLGFLFGSVAWYYCFRSLEIENPQRKLFIIRTIGESFSMINPASVVAGDAMKVYFLQKRQVSVEEATAATLLSRVMLTVSLIFLLIFVSFFLLKGSEFFPAEWMRPVFMGSLILFGIGLIVLLVSPRLFLYRIVRTILGLFSTKAEEKSQSVREINEAMSDYFKQHRRKFFAAFTFSVLHWLTGAAEFWFTLYLIDIPISLTDALTMEVGVMLVKSMGAFVPGQIGVEEKGNELMLGIIGVSTAGVWLIVSIFRRARQLFWILIGGLLYLIYEQRFRGKQ